MKILVGRLLSGRRDRDRSIYLWLCGLAALACSDSMPSSFPVAPTADWVVAEDLRVGSVDDPASALTSIGSLAVDAAGRIYASQPTDNSIRVFDEVGQSLGSYGGPGDGPGEFRQIARIGIFADTLYVSDPTAGRITLFSLDGLLLETVSLRPVGLGEDWIPLSPWWLDEEGRAVALPGFLPALRDPGASYPVLLVRIDREGEIVDTVSLSERPSEQSIRLNGPMGPMVTTQPFTGPFLPVIASNGSPVAVLGEEHAASGRSGTFEISVLRSYRDTLWSRSYSYDGVELTDAIIDRAVTAFVGRLNREAFPDRVDLERQFRSGMALPDHVPPVSGGIFAEDGMLWLRREALGDEHQRWTVLDATGEPVADVVLPASFRPEVVRGSHMWGVEIDDLGVPYIVRFAIHR